MAADLKIEVFSVDLFRRLWYELGITNFVVPRVRNYGNVAIPITCMDAVVGAIQCRRVFLSDMLWSNIYFDYEDYSKSSLDFYLYLQNKMPSFLPYSDLNIFDKLVMACVVVLEMACTCNIRDNNIYKYSAPLCLAMYLDIEYKEKFYNKGGWEGLEIHANSYKATFNRDLGKGDKSSKSAFNNAISVEYSYKLTAKIFEERTRSCKAFCPQCRPLFDVVKLLSCTSNEFIGEYKLREGYLQLLLRLLSKEELQEREKYVLRDAEFESFSEVQTFRYRSTDSKNLVNCKGEKIPYDKIMGYFNQYQILNTHDYLSRLFTSKENSISECMFCNRSLDKLSEDPVAGNDFVKRINSVVQDTLINVKIKDFDANKNPGKDDGVNEILRLFSSLGTQPITSEIVDNLRKKRNSPTKSFPKTSSQRAEENSGTKENKRKKKQKKNRNKE